MPRAVSRMRPEFGPYEVWAGTQFATRAEAEAALLRYIDGWYNPRRIQEGLGGFSPDEYEEMWHRHHDPATIHPEPEPSR